MLYQVVNQTLRPEQARDHIRHLLYQSPDGQYKFPYSPSYASIYDILSCLLNQQAVVASTYVQCDTCGLSRCESGLDYLVKVNSNTRSSIAEVFHHMQTSKNMCTCPVCKERKEYSSQI